MKGGPRSSSLSDAILLESYSHGVLSSFLRFDHNGERRLFGVHMISPGSFYAVGEQISRGLHLAATTAICLEGVRGLKLRPGHRDELQYSACLSAVC